jgi:hypothetical protein
MSISKGAFGQSGKGGFIESRLGARGWPSLFSLIVGGSNSAAGNNLFRLDPDTGATIWGVAIGTSTIRNIKHSPSGRVYIHADEATDRIYEISPNDGSILATSIAVFAQSLDVDSSGKVYARRTTGNDIVRLASDLTTVEAVCDGPSPLGVSVDLAGNIYIAETTSGSAIADKYDSNGNLLVASATIETGYSIFAPAGDYAYVLGLVTGDTLVYKVQKSNLTVVATYSMGETAITTQPQCWATDGTNIYITRSGLAVGEDSFAVKIRISDMTEVARFTTSANPPTGTVTGGISKSGSSYVTVSQRTDEWDGNDGIHKSVWALDSSMGLLWSADPSSTFQALAVSGSFTKR